MHGHEQFAAEVAVRAHRFLRCHVHVGPEIGVGPDRQQRQVERAQRRTRAGKRGRVAGVPAEIRAVRGARERPRRPLRGVARGAAAREVPALDAGHREVADAGGVAPVELHDAALRHAPPAQVPADPERDDEGGVGPCGEGGDRRLVEVVVVVVRDQHCVEGGEPVESGRGRVQAARPDRARRRGPLAPHRVGQHPVAVDLQEHAGVAEPGHRDGARLPVRRARHERDRPGRATRGAAGQQPPEDHRHARRRDQPARLRVAEPSGLGVRGPVRGGAHRGRARAEGRREAPRGADEPGRCPETDRTAENREKAHPESL
jgi:hypothetical protein